jgi:hypothetical protein
VILENGLKLVIDFGELLLKGIHIPYYYLPVPVSKTREPPNTLVASL